MDEITKKIFESILDKYNDEIDKEKDNSSNWKQCCKDIIEILKEYINGKYVY